MMFKRKPPPGNARRVRHIDNNFCGVTTNKRGHSRFPLADLVDSDHRLRDLL